MRTTAEDIACAVLGCGTADLTLLNDVRYDVPEIILGLMTGNYGEFNINDVMREVFRIGIMDLDEAIDRELDEIGRTDEDGDPADIRAERAALYMLRPEEDIQSFHNFLDTHIWIENHAEDYENYLGWALDEFEENTGFSLRP